MKERADTPEIVYRVIDRITGEPQRVYSRSYGDEMDFESPAQARHANCHDLYEDRGRYRIAQYRVTYELLNPDCP